MEHISRGDLACLTHEAAEISGVPFVTDVDRAEVEELMQTLAGDNVGLARAMAHALQHRKSLQPSSPEEQQRIAEIAASKRNGRMIPGGAPPAGKVHSAGYS